jgi:hypothetical protein
LLCKNCCSKKQLFFNAIHIYEVRPRKDHRGVDLIGDALPFRGRCGYKEQRVDPRYTSVSKFDTTKPNTRRAFLGKTGWPRYCLLSAGKKSGALRAFIWGDWHWEPFHG